MALFSQRKGLKPVRTALQVDSMDSDLRNRLWNTLTALYLEGVDGNDFYYGRGPIPALFRRLWHDYFKKPVDTVPRYWGDAYNSLRQSFFECPWYEVYDFLEFVVGNWPHDFINSMFMKGCNSVLEEELSAYRFVGGKIVEITTKEEITEIETALRVTDSLTPVRTHLETALGLFADRKSPDPRNSIKESISAVEAMARLIAGKSKTTLDEALKEIEKRVRVHPALKAAFSKMYGYTSDADGIRHALLDETDLKPEDAKFFLVSCSAFVNYLVAKASRANIKLSR